MKKIKNISHARIAEHMKQLKNAELPEHAGTAEHKRLENSETEMKIMDEVRGQQGIRFPDDN